MASCARCGNDLGDAAVCDRCGTPSARYAEPGVAGHVSRGAFVRDAGDTAERPAVAGGRHAATRTAPEAVVPPPSPEPTPTNARFPLYADEVVPARTSPEEWPPPAYPTVAPPDDDLAVVDGDAAHRSLGDLLPWILLGVAAIGLVLVGAVWLLFRPGADTASDASTAASSSRGSQDSPADSTADSAGDSEDGADDGGASQEPSAGGGRTTTGPSRDVSATATALVPDTAPPNQDVRGRPVRYDSDQMFDGDPSTAWRMPGDGTDALLTIRLAEPTQVRRVGLVNGYAKEDVDPGGRTVRWYPRNRRITRVTWSFDDGSIVKQRLRQRPTMQTVRVDREVTRTIRLRLVDVTAPMPGRLGRNYTAISEIRINGAPVR
jgi:hypothetical protein